MGAPINSKAAAEVEGLELIKRLSEPTANKPPVVAPAKTPTFSLIRITKKGGPLSKTISIGADEELIVDSSACAMSRGEARSVLIEQGMSGLAELYASLSPNEAVVFSNTDLGPE